MEQEIADKIYKDKKNPTLLDAFREIFVRNKLQKINAKIENLQQQKNTWARVNSEELINAEIGTKNIKRKHILQMITQLDQASKEELLLKVRNAPTSSSKTTVMNVMTGLKSISSALM